MTEYGWIFGLAALVLTLMTMQASFGAWISRRFAELNNSLIKMREDVLNKLEYHERHDDQRFQTMTNEIFDIRLWLARTQRTDQWPLEKQSNSPQSAKRDDS